MSEFIEIEGGIRLKGEVTISGAKNAALPLLMVSLLTSEELTFENVPNLDDVGIVIHLLEQFGAEVNFFGSSLKISVPRLHATEASYSLVKALRASFWILGPLLARGRAARVALPGGDIIGARPVDIHLEALSKMGAEFTVKHGVILARAERGLKPATIAFRFPSVGATHQIMMAAALTPGTTVIKGAAREPEVVELGRLLQTMGAEIEGAGESEVIIRGKAQLGGAAHHLIGDRIEAGTFLFGALATRGTVTVKGVNPSHLNAALNVMREMGADIESGADYIKADCSKELNPVEVATGPFPEFPTDLQAPLMAVLAGIKGHSRVEENIFEGRFAHVSELCRMGAKITVEERTAIVDGVDKLVGAPVEGHDIRACAALTIAALSASGITQISDPHHLKRGYENFEEKVAKLGAIIRSKVSDSEDFLFAGC